MKFLPIAVAFAAYSSGVAMAAQEQPKASLRGAPADALAVEDEVWFNRYVQEVGGSFPTPEPTPAPTICTIPPVNCPSEMPSDGGPMPTLCTPPPHLCPTEQPSPNPTPEPTPAPTICTIPPVNCPSEMPSDGGPMPTLCTPPPHLCPTEQPSPNPTPEPTPMPTIRVTPNPTPSSPAPTGDCDLNITLAESCPCVPCEFDVCQERPWRMMFYYPGGDCNETEFRRCPEGEKDDLCTCIKEPLGPEYWGNKFTCEDDPTMTGNFPPDKGTEGLVYIIAAPAGKTGDPESRYFNGTVEVGGYFNATDPKMKKVEANMDLFVYDADPDQGGTILQEVLFHSSCSQQLFLTDTFGGFQLVEFESDDLIVSLFRSPTFKFNMTLDFDSGGSELVMETANVVLLSDAGLLPPQIEVFDVEGTTIPPPFSAEANFTIIMETNFTAIASIGGVLDGERCFDVTSTTFVCEQRSYECPEDVRRLTWN